MSTPRKHHYVPRAHLARFTHTGERDGMLWVLETASGRQWRSNPNDTGCERDCYLLEPGENSEPDVLAVEHFFAGIEDAASEAIAATLREGRVPEGALRVQLVGYLAAQAVRVPGSLRAWDEFSDRLMQSVAWYLTSSPTTWRAHTPRMREAGNAVQTVPYEQIREFVRSGDFASTVDQNTRLATVLTPLPTLAAALGERHWTLVVAEEGAPDFICSDRPLSVCWNDPPKSAWPPPGLGLLGTTVMFPMGRRAALLGMFEGPFPTTTANARLVGIVNMWTAFYATRYVYSAEPDFHVILPDGRVGSRDDVVAHCHERQRKRTASNR